MEVEFLILADAAQAVNGKLYVLGGGWSTLHPVALPLTHQVSVAAGFRIPWNETNQVHHIEIAIVTADGNPIVPPLRGELEMGRPAGLRPGSDQTPVIAMTANTRFERDGRYEVQVRVEDQIVKTITFDVAPPAKASPPAP